MEDPIDNNQNEFSKDDEKKLLKEINDFTKWLKQKSIIRETLKIERTFDFPFASEDWIMKVEKENKRVSFNIYIYNNNECSFEYYTIVILHEFFHLVVQRVPNKDDATKIKDDFGGEFMKLIDIEADYYIALYLKERKNYTLVKYWEVNYEGGKIFVDKWIRTIKFERFIGTLLSVGKMFMDDSNEKDLYELYLPTLNPIYTEESLHILVLKKTHIYFDEIEANYTDFVNLKGPYENVSNFKVKDYVEELLKFTFKALKIDFPHNIKIEIESLK